MAGADAPIEQIDERCLPEMACNTFVPHHDEGVTDKMRIVCKASALSLSFAAAAASLFYM